MDEINGSKLPAIASAVPGASDAALDPVTRPSGPWGFWPSIGWTFVIGLGWVLAQIAAIVFYVVWKMTTGTKQAPNALEIETSGLVLALAVIFSSPMAVGLVILFAWLRKGIRIGDYLAWKWPGTKIVIRWCLAFLAFIALSDATSSLMGRPLVPDVMVNYYRQADIVWLLWLALMLFGPFAEEFMFRGFLFAGLRSSRLGGLGTVILTSAAWTTLHLQYDAYGMLCVFLSGLFLGYARLRTGSLPLCILLHSFMNLLATIETVFLLS